MKDLVDDTPVAGLPFMYSNTPGVDKPSETPQKPSFSNDNPPGMALPFADLPLACREAVYQRLPFTQRIRMRTASRAFNRVNDGSLWLAGRPQLASVVIKQMLYISVSDETFCIVWRPPVERNAGYLEFELVDFNFLKFNGTYSREPRSAKCFVTCSDARHALRILNQLFRKTSPRAAALNQDTPTKLDLSGLLLLRCPMQAHIRGKSAELAARAAKITNWVPLKPELVLIELMMDRRGPAADHCLTGLFESLSDHSAIRLHLAVPVCSMQRASAVAHRLLESALCKSPPVGTQRRLLAVTLDIGEPIRYMRMLHQQYFTADGFRIFTWAFGDFEAEVVKLMEGRDVMLLCQELEYTATLLIAQNYGTDIDAVGRDASRGLMLQPEAPVYHLGPVSPWATIGEGVQK
ncbi:unnamed protein product, partial [Mesorhabditis spiculigera]